MPSAFRWKRIGSSSRCNECSPGVTGRPISLSPVRALWAALSLRKYFGKRCNARSNTPSAMAGASRVTCLLLQFVPFHDDRPPLRAATPPSAGLPCENPLRMLLLHFPKQPAADYSRGPHGGVDEAAGCESVQSSLPKG